MFGPLPLFVCHSHFFLKLTITLQAAFFLDAIIVLRYIFIFWLKNPAAFQEEFWSLFINIWVVAFSWTAQFVLEVFLGCDSTPIQICMRYERQVSYNCYKFPWYLRINNMIMLASIFLYAIILVKIHIFKNGKGNKTQTSPESKQSWLEYMEQQSVTDVTASLLTVIGTVLSIFATRIVNFLFSSNHTAQPSYLDEYFNSMIRPPLTVLLLVLLYFSRHENLRKTVWREMGFLHMDCFSKRK